MHELQFEELIYTNKGKIIEFGEKTIDFRSSMRWMMLEWGWVIETSYFDTEQTTTIETLVSYDGATATIIDRYRFGPNHNEIMPYPRDNLYPIASIVRLLPCSKLSSCHTQASAKA